MNMFRMIFSLPFAALVTAGLFAMMAGLIAQDNGELPPLVQSPDIQILAEDPPEGVKPNSEKPRKINEEMPETIIPPTLPGEKPKGIPIRPNPEPVEIEPPAGPGGMSGPVIRTSPVYPEACRGRSAQGVVLVQFDVTPEGNVVNIRIIESANACFNRTVRNTVSKWKYAPAYQNGRPVMRYGVVEQIRFELTD